MLLLLQLLTCTYVQIFYWFKKIDLKLLLIKNIPFQATLYYMYANLTDLEIPVCKKSDDVPME